MTDKLQQTQLRDLPSIDTLLKTPEVASLIDVYGRDLTVIGLRHCLGETRAAILGDKVDQSPGNGCLLKNVNEWLQTIFAPTLQPVINGTGVIVHTNLGRAPLSERAIEAIKGIAGDYSTLEYDVAAGSRGSRATHAAAQLAQVTGAPATLVVNNNAAAVLLMLTTLCAGKEVIISRGQLVEIGGGFRIPDVMAQSGARLVEVGTTNRTHLHDYENAITDNTAALLVAHHSNFKIIGFTQEPSLKALADLAAKYQIPLLFDQGSGALLDTTPYGLAAEPTVGDGLAAGCSLVAFSGDKLLGGPQAGILAGQEALVEKCKKHPLARAVRADKLCLAALSATMTAYLAGKAVSELPVWQMIARTQSEIEAEAKGWLRQLEAAGLTADLVDGQSTVGGGSLPGTSLPTILISITHRHVDQLAASLRRQVVPVIGRIQDNRFMLDPRTVLSSQVDILIQSLIHCMKE